MTMAGCTTPDNRTDIVISSSGFKIDNELYTSRSSLTAALIAKKVTRVHFVPQKDAEYKQVEAALLAAQDAGATDIGLVGNIGNE